MTTCGRKRPGKLPKRPKGSDCKSDCIAFGGSNPSLATEIDNAPRAFCGALSISVGGGGREPSLGPPLSRQPQCAVPLVLRCQDRALWMRLSRGANPSRCRPRAGPVGRSPFVGRRPRRPSLRVGGLVRVTGLKRFGLTRAVPSAPCGGSGRRTGSKPPHGCGIHSDHEHPPPCLHAEWAGTCFDHVTFPCE